MTLAFSCNKNDDGSSTPEPSTNDNFIRAKVDGVAYEATGSNITREQNEPAFNMSTTYFGGGTGLDFSIRGEATIGTYNFSNSVVTTVGRLNYRDGATTDVYSTAYCPTSSGVFTITSKTGKTIEGTFSFTGRVLSACSGTTVEVTEGTFKITFP